MNKFPQKILISSVIIGQIAISSYSEANQAYKCENIFKGNYFRSLMENEKSIAKKAFMKASGIPHLAKAYDRLGQIHSSEKDPWNSALEALKIKTYYSEEMLNQIPETGPIIVIGNHPFGGVDGVTAVALLKKRRPDVKVMMTDEFGKMIPEIADDIIGVNLGGGKAAKEHNAKQVEVLKQWLADGHAVVMFPAGEISRARSAAEEAYDSWWKPTVAKLSRQLKAKVIPINYEGQNSDFFLKVTRLSDQTVENKWPSSVAKAKGVVEKLKAVVRSSLYEVRVGTIVSNLANKIDHSIKVNIGKPVDPTIFNEKLTDQQVADFLQMLTYSLAENPTSEISVDAMMKEKFPPRTQLVNPRKAKLAEIEARYQKIADPIDTKILESEFFNLIERRPDRILHQTIDKTTKDPEFTVVLADYQDIPQTMLEIGRLREIAFRDINEGSGLSRDIDKYDQWYKQMYVWDHKQSRIVGVYRVAFVKEIIQKYGLQGLYTNSLVKYNEKLIHHLTNAIELGRAALHPDYQGTGAVDLLFHGLFTIGKRNPEVRSYFGPVSISGSYSNLSILFAIEYIRQNFPADKKTIAHFEAMLPPKPEKQIYDNVKIRAIVSQLGKWGQLDQLVEQIDGKGLPPLLRMYTTWGGRYTVFNTDPAFNSVDGYIVLDAADLNQKLVLNRYMGKDEGAKYYEFQQARRQLLNKQVGH